MVFLSWKKQSLYAIRVPHAYLDMCLFVYSCTFIYRLTLYERTPYTIKSLMPNLRR